MKLKAIACAALMAAYVPASASADEIEDVLTGALEAYQAGDAKLAKEEVEYVLELLKEIQGNAMAELLPAPLDGWSLEMTDDAGAFAMMGGQAVSGRYENGNEYFEVIIGNSPQLMGMGAMFANAATMGAMGEVTRVQRERFVITDDQIMGLVDERMFVQFEGTDPEAMRAHLETLDIGAIKDF